MEPPVASFSYYNDLVLLVVSLILCALFSFIETSITSLRLFKLKEIAQATGKYKSLFQVFEKDPNRILITILVAYNLANVLAAVFSSQLMEKVSQALNISERLGFAIGIFVTTTTILITDLIPKNIATTHGEKLFKSTLWITNIMYYALHPFVSFLSRFINAASRIIAGEQAHGVEESVTSEKEIQFLIDYINEKGLMERHKTAMLKSIFELGTTPIKDIMVPETSVISINANSTQREALELFAKYHFTRMPVYEETRDNIIGMVHQKDLFQLLSKNEERYLKDIVRPIMFIPETAKVLKALKDFMDQRMHIAMVINEYGGISGLVTLEDVIEEIVGEISDEYESVPEKVIALKSGALLVDGSIDLEDLEGLINIIFDTEDALTLGGFLIEHFQYVPQNNESLSYKGYKFVVKQADPKRVSQVLVYPEDIADKVELE
jgi:putative hemolysin